MNMSVETLGMLFGVFSAVANIVIAVIAARGRWWEKADRMEDFMAEIKTETTTMLREIAHITTTINDMKLEYKEFNKAYSSEMRDLQSKISTQEHRLNDIERRLNSK